MAQKPQQKRFADALFPSGASVQKPFSFEEKRPGVFFMQKAARRLNGRLFGKKQNIRSLQPPGKCIRFVFGGKRRPGIRQGFEDFLSEQEMRKKRGHVFPSFLWIKPFYTQVYLTIQGKSLQGFFKTFQFHIVIS
jgi:hypothetical protein